MPEEINIFKCPNCDGPLIFDSERQLFACEFCLSEFTKDALDLLRGDIKAREKAVAAESEAYCETMNAYHCPSCGADVAADKNTVAGFCPYCHNPIQMIGRLSGDLKPDRIIPFAFDKKEALVKFVKEHKRRWFLPRNFFTKDDTDRVTGVYYPFWVTDADTDSVLTGEGRKVRSWRAGNVQYTETTHYAITRRGDIHFEDIVTNALSEADKKMLEGILPYPSDSLKEFDTPYLSGFLAKKRDIAKEALAAEVKGRMNGYAKTLLAGTVQGYNGVTYNAPLVKVIDSTWEYALMPIYILTYKRNGKVYNYAMNGHTGRVYGKLPINGGKLAGVAGGLAAALAGLAYLAFHLLGMIQY
jgi:DNA-directed RNA polymerase subunit RPC12/RpoP